MKAFKAESGSPAGLFLSTLLCALFFIPYLVFLKYFHFSWGFDPGEVFWALRNSLVPSVAAAAAVTALGIPLSGGVRMLPARWRSRALGLLLAPQVFPVLYSLLIAFSLLKPFPMGVTGVGLVFALINLGFAGVLLFGAAERKLVRLAAISEVYGLGRTRFLWRIYLPLLRRDLVVVFFMVLVMCMASFSVPLIAGGGRGTNLEVLIYEKIFIQQDWNAAFTLSMLQTLLIFLVSLRLFGRRPEQEEAAPFAGSRRAPVYLRSAGGLTLGAAYVILYLGGYFTGLRQSLGHLPFLFMYIWDLGAAALFTAQALAAYLLVNFLLLVLWLADFLRRGRFNPAVHLVSLSTVVTGFSLYLLFPVSARYDLPKISLGMTLLLFPVLFRLFLQRPVEELGRQITVARVHGLPARVILVEVILRQIRRPLLGWLAFLILWFAGDYAILKALGVQTQTLGLMSAGFLSSYRLPLSYLMSAIILLFWAVMTAAVWVCVKVGYVVYKKLAL